MERVLQAAGLRPPFVQGGSRQPRHLRGKRGGVVEEPSVYLPRLREVDALLGEGEEAKRKPAGVTGHEDLILGRGRAARRARRQQQGAYQVSVGHLI